MASRGHVFCGKDGQPVRMCGVNFDITESKRNEALIRELALFPAQNPAPVMRVDREGRLLYANASAQPFLDHWRPDKSDRVPGAVVRAVSLALAGNKPFTEELACDERLFSFDLTPMPEYGYANLYGHDITEQRQTETALRESEERMRQAMVVGKVFSFEWDPVRDVTIRTDNSADILGHDPRDCTPTTGKAHLARIPTADRAPFEKRIRDLTPGTPKYETTYRYTRGDGRVIWLEESGCAEFDTTGRMTRLRGIVADVTERVEIQRRERENAAARSAIDTVDAMGEGVILFRLDGVVIAANPAVEKMTGIARNEMIGRNMFELTPRLLNGPDLDAAMAGLDEAAREQVPDIDRIMTLPGDKAPISVSPSITFIMTPDLRPATAVLTLKDLTRLHQAHELLTQIFDNTHMLMAYLDSDFNFIRVNRAYAAANRFEPDQFIGRNHFDLYPHAENQAVFRQVRDSGEPYVVFEKPFDHPDHPGRGTGTGYWDWSLRPIRDDNRQTQGLLLCLVDVTKRVRMREQYMQSEENYRNLVESVDSIIMRVLPDRRISYVNAYACTFFGFTAEELLGRTVCETLVRQNGGSDLVPGCADAVYACKNGQRVWVHWSNRALHDDQGNLLELLCVGSDITKRKRLEDEATNYRRRLRSLAERLVDSEEEERLRVSSHIHDTVIQSLSLANIRLSGLRGIMEQAGMTDADKNLQPIRDLIEACIGECRGLMADLTPPLLYEFGLGPALCDFADNQQALHGCVITVDIDPRTPTLDRARRGFVFQAARELVINAIKHAGPCTIRINVELAGAELRMSVSDTGHGLDPHSDKLFAMDKTGGFGLFNIRERLQNLGGKLELDAAPGRGTCVTVRLPL